MSCKLVKFSLSRKKLLVAASLTGSVAVAAGLGVYLHQTDPTFFANKTIFPFNT